MLLLLGLITLSPLLLFPYFCIIIAISFGWSIYFHNNREFSSNQCTPSWQSGSYQCTRSTKPMIVCGIGNPLTDTTGRLHLTFIKSGEPFDSRFIDFTVSVNSSSVELTEQDPLRFRVEVIKRAEISIIGYVYIYFGSLCQVHLFLTSRMLCYCTLL